MKKLDASEIYPKRLNAKEVLITQKDGDFAFPVADGSARLSGRDCEFQEPTLGRESTVRRENLSGDSHGDWEEFRLEELEDDAEAREDSWFIQGYFIYCHHIEPRVQLVCREQNHSLFHKIYVIERNFPEKKYTMRRRDRKSQNIRGKNKFNCIDLAGNGRNSVPYYIFAQDFVLMKRS